MIRLEQRVRLRIRRVPDRDLRVFLRLHLVDEGLERPVVVHLLDVPAEVGEVRQHLIANTRWLVALIVVLALIIKFDDGGVGIRGGGGEPHALPVRRIGTVLLGYVNELARATKARTRRPLGGVLPGRIQVVDAVLVADVLNGVAVELTVHHHELDAADDVRRRRQ